MRCVQRLLVSAALVAGLAAAAGCSGSGQYVWFTSLPPAAANPPHDYLINVGDTVDVRVLSHEEVSVKEKVRVDGRIAVPLIGEVEARGKRPSALRAELEGRLKDFIVSPSVTVNVSEVEKMTILLLGEVSHPGAIQVQPNASLAEALAMAGGLTDYASKDSIYLVRQEPAPMRVRFTYQAILRNEGHAGEYPLRSGDLVEVE